jgi:ATP-dependent Clp protease ATP-binding subunit ClpC
LNRIDEVVFFNSLHRKDLFRIIDLEMSKVEARLVSKKLVLHLSDAARNFIVDKGFNPEYGARPLRRTIEKLVEDPLAEEMLRGQLADNSLIEISHVEKEDALVFKAIPVSEAPEEEEETASAGSGTEDDSE